MKNRGLLTKAIILTCTLLGFSACNRQEATSQKTELQTLTSAQREYCVDRAIKTLAIDMELMSDPKLFGSILGSEMLLADLPAARALFEKELTQTISLKPMLQRIRSGIINRQPAISEFLCAALDARLITPVEESKDVIVKIAHHTYLLNELTGKMANDNEFMQQVRQHLVAKRAKFGIRSDLVGSFEDYYRIIGDVFEPTKIVTMDWVFDEYARFRTQGFIEAAAMDARAAGTKLNILEASITEKAAGFHDNAMTGAALAINPPKKVTVRPETTFLEYELSERWAALYETWNFAFITGNISYLHIYYPKLLIPVVIDAEHNDYLFNRAIALWVSLNFRQFALLMAKPDVPFPHKKELASLWGTINHKYAIEMVRIENGKDLSEFAGILDITMAQIMEQLKKFLNSILTPEEAARLDEIFEKDAAAKNQGR